MGVNATVVFLDNCIFQDCKFKRSYICTSYLDVSLLCIARIWKKTHSNEMKLVIMLRNNPGTTKAPDCHELETAGPAVLLSTVKLVLHQHGLRGYRPKKKLLQNRCLKFAAAHTDKPILNTFFFFHLTALTLNVSATQSQFVSLYLPSRC